MVQHNALTGADLHDPKAHNLNSHNACSLAELNAVVSDATLIDTGDSRLSDARTPTAHNQSAATITSGTLPVSRGGTGVTGDTYDADKVDGKHATDLLLLDGTQAMAANLDMNNKDIINILRLFSKFDTDGLIAYGGDSDIAGSIALYGKNHASAPGMVSLEVPDAAKSTMKWALRVYGISNTPKVTIAFGLDMSSKKIENVLNPTVDQDAATKKFVDDHNWAATDVTSGTLPVARGGTGVTGDTYDADKVDGCDAGSVNGDVYKIPGSVGGSILYYNDAGSGIVIRNPSTDGYQLTTHAAGNAPTWAAASDLIFSDTHCPKCGKKFEGGDNLILHVIGHNEVGDILTIPMHQSCANLPKKTVMIRRKVMEDQYVLDELTGEPKVQRVQKMQEKTVTKHKLKEGYVLDNKSGKAFKIDEDGKRGKTNYNLSDALETVGETVSEVVYEDVEFLL